MTQIPVVTLSNSTQSYEVAAQFANHYVELLDIVRLPHYIDLRIGKNESTVQGWERV